jgi:general secretion pathway protein A
MKMAGAIIKMPIFTETAIEAIDLPSQGWPCVINRLTIDSLLFGYQLKKEHIDEEIVRMAIESSSL